MINPYKFKKYFWSSLGIMGVVLFWAGIWDGLGNLSYLQNPLISLLAGAIILLSSNLFLKATDQKKEKDNGMINELYKILKNPAKQKYEIVYFDKIKKKNLKHNAKYLIKIEKESFLVFQPKKNQEILIPINRVKEIKKNNE